MHVLPCKTQALRMLLYVCYFLLLLFLQAMLKSDVKKTYVHMYVATNTHLISRIKSPSNFHAIVIQLLKVV